MSGSGSESDEGSAYSDDGAKRAWFTGFTGHEEKYEGLVGMAPSTVRKGFIQKVYTILTFQLILTFLIAAPFQNPALQPWIHSNTWIMWPVYMMCLGAVVGVACCCQSIARTFPYNYIFLLFVTVCISIVVGFVTAFYTTSSVILAVAATAVTFGMLTAYACFTKTDFTGLGPYLMGALFAMIGMSFVITFVGLFFELPPWVQVVYSILGVLLFSFYIIYDTQMIVGGNHKNQFSVDDYVFAALNLYLDIINLFLYLLSLLGSRN